MPCQTIVCASPEEEPPVVRSCRQGLSTGPLGSVWLPAERQKGSSVVLPRIVPPAAPIAKGAALGSSPQDLKVSGGA